MYRQCFCSQRECQKCIFQQLGDLNFKNFPFNVHHELNLWGKTAASKSAWVKAWEHKNKFFRNTKFTLLLFTSYKDMNKHFNNHKAIDLVKTNKI